MTKLIMHDKEHPNPDHAPQENSSITDARGRTLTLKKPNALAQYRLVDALGPSAENRVYLAMCMPFLYLSAIDGEAVLMPTSKMQIEALVQRLDTDGLDALNAGIEKYFGATTEEDSLRAKKSAEM